MNLTRESEYALKGLAQLATYPIGTTVSMAEIAAEQQLPTSFLAKIFQKLARHGLLDAERGRGSGYMLSREPAAIGMREILEAVEGPMALKQCLLWSGHCSESEPCPLHNRLKPFRSQLDQMLNEVTLADYVEVSFNANPPATEDSGAS